RQAIFDAHPVPTAVVTAVHAAMILLIEPLRRPRRHDDTVYTLTKFRVFLIIRHIVRAGTAIARRPRFSGVGRIKNTGRGNRDPNLIFIIRVRNDGMQDETTAARLPLWPRWMLSQASNVRPGLSAVIAAKKAGRLDTCEKRIPLTAREAPCRLDRILAFSVRKPLAGMRPGLAEIGGLPNSGAEPLVPTRSVNHAIRWIADDMIERPGFAKWPTELP